MSGDASRRDWRDPEAGVGIGRIAGPRQPIGMAHRRGHSFRLVWRCRRPADAGFGRTAAVSALRCGPVYPRLMWISGHVALGFRRRYRRRSVAPKYAAGRQCAGRKNGHRRVPVSRDARRRSGGVPDCLRRRSSLRRSPSWPGCSGRSRRTWAAGCGSRCSRRAPRRRCTAAPCRRW